MFIVKPENHPENKTKQHQEITLFGPFERIEIDILDAYQTQILIINMKYKRI